MSSRVIWSTKDRRESLSGGLVSSLSPLLLNAKFGSDRPKEFSIPTSMLSRLGLLEPGRHYQLVSFTTFSLSLTIIILPPAPSRKQVSLMHYLARNESSLGRRKTPPSSPSIH